MQSMELKLMVFTILCCAVSNSNYGDIKSSTFHHLHKTFLFISSNLLCVRYLRTTCHFCFCLPFHSSLSCRNFYFSVLTLCFLCTSLHWPDCLGLSSLFVSTLTFCFSMITGSMKLQRFSSPFRFRHCAHCHISCALACVISHSVNYG